MMEAFLNKAQTPAFIMFLMTGFGASLFYDTAMIFLNKRNLVIRSVYDVFLCSATVFILLFVIGRSGEKTLRFYMIVSFILGVCTYTLIIRRIVEKFIEGLTEKRKSKPDGE